MKRILLLIVAVVVLLLSCDDGSSYINYTWDDSTVDADSDGIPDIAEESGTSFYGMPLNEWGALPGVPDLFVHIAPMVPGTDDGGMMLQEKALDRVVAKFAENGIALHFDVGSNGLYKEYTDVGTRGVDRYNLSNKSHLFPYNKSVTLEGSSSSYVYVDDLMNEQLSENQKQVFYFMVMGSSQNSDGSGGSSGVAYVGGRRFLITLANWNLGFGINSTLGLTRDNYENYVVNTQASTIMHEFGHNLGLHHGGNESTNYKPNYYSIMNYLYQLNGLPRIGTNEWDRYYYERYYESFDSAANTADEKWADLMDQNLDGSIYSAYANAYEETYPGEGTIRSKLVLLPMDFIDNRYSSTFSMDYSHGDSSGILDETALVENSGLLQTGSMPVNWDGDGDDQGTVSENLNPAFIYDSTRDIKVYDFSENHDYSDWNNLRFYYDEHAPGVSRLIISDDYEIVVEEIRDLSPIPMEGY